jgi:hypothetical protein
VPLIAVDNLSPLARFARVCVLVAGALACAFAIVWFWWGAHLLVLFAFSDGSAFNFSSKLNLLSEWWAVDHGHLVDCILSLPFPLLLHATFCVQQVFAPARVHVSHIAWAMPHTACQGLR